MTHGGKPFVGAYPQHVEKLGYLLSNATVPERMGQSSRGVDELEIVIQIKRQPVAALLSNRSRELQQLRAT